jgi:cyclopropane fatty-acyl-phospholipid synthase-like methyltransferase
MAYIYKETAMKAQYQTYPTTLKSNSTETSASKVEVLNNLVLLNGLTERKDVQHLQTVVKEHFVSISGLNALDLGARRGGAAMVLATAGFDVLALDMYRSSIPTLQKIAMQQELNISFGMGAITDIEKLNKQFDLIHDVEFLSDTPCAADRASFLASVKNSLAPEGRVVLTVKVLTADYVAEESFESVYYNQHILWRQTPASDAPGVFEMNGKHWTAQKRLAPVDLVCQELMEAGFKILDQEIEIAAGGPSTLRLVLASN